jgi:transcriptional regulator with XRE-family HTH domain
VPESLAAKLDRLFRSFRRPQGGEYSYEEVARALRARGGPTISATYLWQLRNGHRDNPTKAHLEAIADYFGVSPGYFFDDAAAESVEAQLQLLTAMRDAQVSEIALRSFGLSPETLRAIAQIIENARRAEGLPMAHDAGSGRRSRRRKPDRG